MCKPLIWGTFFSSDSILVKPKSTQIQHDHCTLVGWLVGWLVGRSVGWLVHLFVGWLVCLFVGSIHVGSSIIALSFQVIHGFCIRVRMDQSSSHSISGSSDPKGLPRPCCLRAPLPHAPCPHQALPQVLGGSWHPMQFLRVR